MRLVFLFLLLVSTPLLAAEPRQLWLYYPTNLQSDDNIPKLEQVWRRAAAAGYTHVLLADSKFARLGHLQGMEKRYFGNIEKVKKLAKELNLEVVPALFQIGYSNSMLWHDPNLAEGLPVRAAPFVVRDGLATAITDPPLSLNKPAYKDDSVSIAGATATLTSPVGNARFYYRLTVPPFRVYHVSVKIKTDDFTGRPEIKALAGNRSLQFANLKVKKTQDWTEHHVVFNTLDHEQVNLYFGVWGTARGTLQWKDWMIEEAGLVNVLRRPGAPFSIQGYTEGTDYEPVIDPQLGNQPWAGEYDVWHEPPPIRTRNVPEGARLRVSWHHAMTIYDGQVSCCPSEPKTMDLLADEARRVRAAWGAAGYMMSHDEVRTLNWDASCQERNLYPGRILAENAQACVRLLEGSQVYAWSDMFDPHHNAVKDYYLVRGDLAGSWEGLDKSVTIMNWNFDKRNESLKFFAGRGHEQIIAAYYDGPVERIQQWLAAADGVPGVIGVMYTTWENDYAHMEAFARLCKQ
jgi:hypothetical protein